MRKSAAWRPLPAATLPAATPLAATLLAATLLAATLLAACTNLNSPDASNPTTASAPVSPTAGAMEWRLPKTLLDLAVTYTYVSCAPDPASKLPQVTADVAVTVTPRTVADDNLFTDRPGGTVSVPMAAMQSFWQDRKLSMSRYPSGIVKQLGADTANQTGTIISNVLGFASKAAAIGFGVPGGGAGVVPAACSTAPTKTLAQIAALKKRLTNPGLSDAQSKALTAQLQTLRDKLAIKMEKITVDPGLPNPVPASGVVATIIPGAQQLQKAAWYTGTPGEQKGLQIDVILDFAHASPALIAACPNNQASCAHRPVHISTNTQFRQVAYIPVQVRRGVPPGTTEHLQTAASTPVAFGQFGIPRALPITAGIFQKYDWTMSFLENGEVSDASFGSTASGPAATAALAGAAGTGNTIAGEARAASGESLATLQAEDARLKAQTDIATYQQQIQQLQAKGQWPF